MIEEVHAVRHHHFSETGLRAMCLLAVSFSVSPLCEFGLCDCVDMISRLSRRVVAGLESYCPSQVGAVLRIEPVAL